MMKTGFVDMIAADISASTNEGSKPGRHIKKSAEEIPS